MAASVAWVVGAQGLCGVAKDLTKTASKSAIKLTAGTASGQLFKWVAFFTGSKNAMKGVGFFLGGLLLATLGFSGAVLAMAAALGLVWIASLVLLQRDLGKAKARPKFTELLSKSPAINRLSAARLFLFAARDVWFVVALPVYLSARLGWSHAAIGSFLALWIIGYGAVQALAPRFTGQRTAHPPGGARAFAWAAMLAALTAGLAAALAAGWPAQPVLFADINAWWAANAAAADLELVTGED